MATELTLVGYGEAGKTFANAASWKHAAHVFDLKPKHEEYREDGVIGCKSLDEAISESRHVLSLVTADQAAIAAAQAAPNLAPDTLYFDMNSVAPETKRAAAADIENACARYVDVAIMAPVTPARLNVPLLVSGPHAAQGKMVLETLGFTNVRTVGNEIGRASSIKMIRSVLLKGMEALTVECLIASQKAGVTDEVLASFDTGSAERADYRLDRMFVHGKRRAAEMAEVAKTLEALGVEPLMTRATVQRQDQIGSIGMKTPPEGLNAKLEVLKDDH